MQNILIKQAAKTAAFNEFLHNTRIIPAVKSPEGVERCLQEKSKIVFVLCGDIVTIHDIVTRFKNADKMVLVHIDLIEGLNSSDIAVDFIAKNTHADGILSTKTNLLKYAKSRGLLSVQRFFVLDSMSLINIERQFPLDYANALEILPGLMPKVIRRLARLTDKPVITGGLISDKDDVKSALDAGASAVSTTKFELIGMNL